MRACSANSSLEAFVDKFMLGQTGVNTDVEVNPFPTLDYQAWTQSWATGDSSSRVGTILGTSDRSVALRRSSPLSAITLTCCFSRTRIDRCSARVPLVARKPR